jgi:hypothetical protein
LALFYAWAVIIPPHASRKHATRQGEGERAIMTLTAEERGALCLLANASGNGTTQTFLSAHGFGVPTIAGLVNHGLATMLRESQRTHEKVIVVTRVRITDAGREALQAER